jgi:hypothetical protein
MLELECCQPISKLTQNYLPQLQPKSKADEGDAMQGSPNGPFILDMKSVLSLSLQDGSQPRPSKNALHRQVSGTSYNPCSMLQQILRLKLPFVIFLYFLHRLKAGLHTS